MKFSDWNVSADRLNAMVNVDFAEAERLTLAYLVAHPHVAKLWREQVERQMLQQARADGFLRDW